MRNMMTTKCRKMGVWLDGSREAPLRNHDKIINRSSSQRLSSRWGWSCDSMRSVNLNRNRNMPQYGIRCRISRKSDNIKSSIIKCVIFVTQIHSWIKPKHQGDVSRNIFINFFPYNFLTIFFPLKKKSWTIYNLKKIIINVQTSA